MPQRSAYSAFSVALALGLAPAAQAQTTLNLSTWQAEEPGFGDWWSEVISAFDEAHPDVTIEVQQVPYAEYINQLTIRFASGRPPELVTMPTSGFGSFADQGWLAALDEKIAGTPIETEWSSLQSEMVWDGETQGVLLMGYGFMLFYNSEILENAGVEPPSSFEEFREAVAQAHDPDNGIFGLSAVATEHPTLTLDFVRFIEWQGADMISEGEYNLTDPAVVSAMENYRETVGGHAPLGNNSTIARQLFTDGRTAFLIDGPWMYASLEGASPDVRENLVMVEAPFSPTLGGASNSIHIPKGLDPEVEEAAWSFIEFLSQPEWQQRYTLLTSAPAPRQDVLTPELLEQAPQLESINDAVIGAEPIIPYVRAIRANIGEFHAIVQRAGLRILSTDEPVEDILADLQGELEAKIPLTE